MNVRCIKDVVVTLPSSKYLAYTEGKVYNTHEVMTSKSNRMLADDNRGTKYTIDDLAMPGFFDAHFELRE